VESFQFKTLLIHGENAHEDSKLYFCRALWIAVKHVCLELVYAPSGDLFYNDPQKEGHSQRHSTYSSLLSSRPHKSIQEPMTSTNILSNRELSMRNSNLDNKRLLPPRRSPPISSLHHSLAPLQKPTPLLQNPSETSHPLISHGVDQAINPLRSQSDGGHPSQSPPNKSRCISFES
jgi:hypothetical protein